MYDKLKNAAEVVSHSHFTAKVPENYLSRGFWVWVGQVYMKRQYFLSRPTHVISPSYATGT